MTDLKECKVQMFDTLRTCLGSWQHFLTNSKKNSCWKIIKFFYEFTEKLLLENNFFCYQNAHLFQLIVLNLIFYVPMILSVDEEWPIFPHFAMIKETYCNFRVRIIKCFLINCCWNRVRLPCIPSLSGLSRLSPLKWDLGYTIPYPQNSIVAN